MADVRYPFPGMNPYLEHPDLWPDVHNQLITLIRNSLVPQVRPRYYVAIEERVYIAAPKNRFVGRPDVAVVDPEGESTWPKIEETLAPYRPFLVDLPTSAPDDEVREWYLEVRETAGGEVVMAIELLSPANKQRGSDGFASYLKKRLEILRSRTHLVEIDLLRGDSPLPMTGNPPASDYRIIVSRAWQRPQAHLYAFNLAEPIPDCPIPLRNEDSEATLSLQSLLPVLYEQAGYDLRIDYHAEPVPSLAPANAAWASALLQQAKAI
ncbi:MAG: DUF4058 family protein [Chloroflexi bacterium]|nr:DUF4058 family protein [Chloroflexota bacterium]